MFWLYPSIQASTVYQEDFDDGLCNACGNERGGWVVTDEVDALCPLNIPPTYSSFPINMTDFVFECDIRAVSDGGIWLRSHFDNGTAWGVLLVTGGMNRTGTGLYWHTVHGDSYSGFFNPHDGLFQQGQDIHLRIEVIGDSYSAYLNDSPVPATTLVTSEFSCGRVALYDYSSQRFDNILITASGLPPDTRNDYRTDLYDFAAIAETWLRVDCITDLWCSGTDYDLNGAVNLTDLVILAQVWLGTVKKIPILVIQEC